MNSLRYWSRRQETGEMKIRGIILIQDYSLGGLDELLKRDVNGKPFLAWQIEKIQASGRNPIIVLGANGDDLLREIRALSNCDLVFGPNSDDSALYNLKIGVKAAGTCIFALPIQIPFPNEEIWTQLEARFLQLPYRHSVDFIRPQKGGVLGFPAVLTQNGIDSVQKADPTISSLNSLWDNPPETIETEIDDINNYVLETTSFDNWAKSL